MNDVTIVLLPTPSVSPRPTRSDEYTTRKRRRRAHRRRREECVHPSSWPSGMKNAPSRSSKLLRVSSAAAWRRQEESCKFGPAVKRSLQWNGHHHFSAFCFSTSFFDHDHRRLFKSSQLASLDIYSICSTMAAHLDALPADVLIMLMQHLSARDLAMLSRTCRTLRGLVSGICHRRNGVLLTGPV